MELTTAQRTINEAVTPSSSSHSQKSTCTSTSTSTSVGSHCCMVSLDMVAGAFHLRCAVDSALQRRSSGMGKTGNFGDEVRAFVLTTPHTHARLSNP